MLHLRMVNSDDYLFLYEQLKERDETVSISHKAVPSFENHCAFCDSAPYKGWYIVIANIEGNGLQIGHCYLSKNNEIGVFLMKKYQGNGLGAPIVEMLMDRFPEQSFLANINPKNERSIKLFESLGFKHIQNTYKR